MIHARTPVARFLLLVLGVFAIAGALRFWLHDAFPYIADYSEASFRRYWPNRGSLLIHIAGGTLALFAGPFQLWTGLRRRRPSVHRWLGYGYIAGIAISATSSFYLAFFTKADFGLALFILAIAWCASIAMALVAIRNGRVDAHQDWMIRSYIITFSFVSYRYLVGLSVFAPLGASKHSMVLWISWVVPMMAYELVHQLDRVRALPRRAQRAGLTQTQSVQSPIPSPESPIVESSQSFQSAQSSTPRI